MKISYKKERVQDVVGIGFFLGSSKDERGFAFLFLRSIFSISIKKSPNNKEVGEKKQCI